MLALTWHDGYALITDVPNPKNRVKIPPLFILFFFVTGGLLLFSTIGAASASDAPPGPSAAAQAPEEIPSAQTYFHAILGHHYAKEGKWEEALKSYEKALSQDPDSPFLLVHAATVLQQLKRGEEAIQHMERARKYQQTNVGLLKRIANFYLAEGDKKKTAEVYEEIITQQPHEIKNHLILARFFLRNGELSRAQTAAERAIQAAPADPLGPYFLAKIFMEQKETVKGIEQYQKAMTLDPPHLQTHLELGTLYEQFGLLEKAEQLYQIVIDDARLRPTEALLRLSRMMAQRKAFAEALRLLDLLEKRHPNDAEVWRRRAQLLALQGKFSEAIEAFQTVWKQQPTPDHRAWLASLYEGEGQYDQALRIYQELPNQGGNRYVTHLRLSALYFYRLKDNTKALSEVETAHKIDPQKPEAYLVRGQMLHQMGQIEEAARQFEEGIKIAPDHATLPLHLAQSYAALNRQDELVQMMEKAITLSTDRALVLNNWDETLNNPVDVAGLIVLLTRAVSLQPERSVFLDSLGWAYYKQGEIQEALKWLKKAAQQSPDDAMAWEHLGYAYFKDRQRDLAREAWTRSLQLNPANEALKVRLWELAVPLPGS